MNDKTIKIVVIGISLTRFELYLGKEYPNKFKKDGHWFIVDNKKFIVAGYSPLCGHRIDDIVVFEDSSQYNLDTLYHIQDRMDKPNKKLKELIGERL